MSIKKVTIHLPEEALERAMRITGKGITDTLVEEIERRRDRSAVRKMRGRVRFDLDLERTRR